MWGRQSALRFLYSIEARIRFGTSDQELLASYCSAIRLNNVDHMSVFMHQLVDGHKRKT